MKPILAMPPAVQLSLMSMVPTYEACVLGPTPLGSSDRFRFEIIHIAVGTREEAEEACWDHAKAICRYYGYIYDDSEWEILYLRCRNCN